MQAQSPTCHACWTRTVWGRTGVPYRTHVGHAAARRHCPCFNDLEATTRHSQVAGAVVTAAAFAAAAGCGGSLGRLTTLTLRHRTRAARDNSALVLAPLAQLTRLTHLSLAAPVCDGSGGAWLPPSLVALRLEGEGEGWSMAPPLGASWMLAVRACTRLESLELINLAPCDVQLAADARRTPRAPTLAGTLAQARRAAGAAARACRQPRVLSARLLI